MVFAKPHFLLFCDASVSSCARSDTDPVGGRWHFVLERIDAAERLEAADGERGQPKERLALLAVVRGLEAIEQPSQVTLVTTSRYVARGLRYGLAEWRETGYIWETFGVRKPIRNADLWQRIDGAMQFHVVACRLLESSMAQQVTSVAEEAANQVDDLDVPVDEMEIASPAIPAPHFPVRPNVRLNGRKPEQDVWYEPEAEEDTVAGSAGRLATVGAAPAKARAVQAGSVRSVPRSHLGRQAGSRSYVDRQAGSLSYGSWWQLASGWLGKLGGRTASLSR